MNNHCPKDYGQQNVFAVQVKPFLQMHCLHETVLTCSVPRCWSSALFVAVSIRSKPAVGFSAHPRHLGMRWSCCLPWHEHGPVIAVLEIVVPALAAGAGLSGHQSAAWSHAAASTAPAAPQAVMCAQNCLQLTGCSLNEARNANKNYIIHKLKAISTLHTNFAIQHPRAVNLKIALVDSIYFCLM